MSSAEARSDQDRAPAAGTPHATAEHAAAAAALRLLEGAAAFHPAGAAPGDVLRRVAAYRSAIAALEEVLGAPGGEGDGAADASGAGPAAPVEAGAEAAAGAARLPLAAPAAGAAATAAAAAAADAAAADAGAAAAAAAAGTGWRVPPHCVPIHANVTTFDWAALAAASQFDVVMMDPPWQLATSNPTRGVALGYSQLSDESIAALPVPALQARGGLLFVWAINAKYRFVLDLFDAWGYELVDEIVWVKTTPTRRLFKSHGYYLQHAKETCLVGRRGAVPGAAAGVCSDVIVSERRGQSQKPEEIYDLIEALVPAGCYLEIFARRNNLRNFWVSIGNEVGVGLPESDLAALRSGGTVPGAKYGRGVG
ncbi:hypothetical protein Rsub_04242 [Raphidocelis subcapitata]|uniref:mRNA m(6)A methyltransferase n=1 Tax=Raphidocelis subcapitata TaxID=307507 RepID=A0A2V0NXU8_9CHLO|nr:hypothetical protein Rsub_04242 [Raphidocelis subcapitata]|eukprot:GBF91502.1 hypothetical protein Rsub_04242 [Raphidocelis subcapitata]